jgi:hypothetical protein
LRQVVFGRDEINAPDGSIDVFVLNLHRLVTELLSTARTSLGKAIEIEGFLTEAKKVSRMVNGYRG